MQNPRRFIAVVQRDQVPSTPLAPPVRVDGEWMVPVGAGATPDEALEDCGQYPSARVIDTEAQGLGQ